MPRKKNTVRDTNESQTKFIQRNIGWKRDASLLTLCILEFIGAIFCAISLKKFFMIKVLGNQYDDSKPLSVSSDLIATIVIVLYALSVYSWMKPA